MILLRKSTILSCLMTGSRSFSKNLFSSNNNIRIINCTFSANTAKMSFHNKCFDYSSPAYFSWKKVHKTIVWKRICRISSASHQCALPLNMTQIHSNHTNDAS
jgi:hypothetical protein